MIVLPPNPMAQKSIQVRIDEDLKKRAEAVFSSIGIDGPTAVRVFYTKVVATGGIPFFLGNEEQYTPEQLAAIDALAEEALRGENLSPPYSSAEELIAALRS